MSCLGEISVTLLVCCLPVLLSYVLFFRVSRGICQTCPVSTSTWRECLVSLELLLFLRSPYDCAIDLLPGTSPTKGRLYSLSAPKREAIEKYISDSLAAKIIRLSSSPAGVGFVFVEKKDGSLHPCIDYRGLNSITVKNTYPLHWCLLPSSVCMVRCSSRKSDLRNAYHLVRMRGGWMEVRF